MLNNKHILHSKLIESFSVKLPGTRSQMKMVPGIRQKELERLDRRDDAREAAVLIALYEDKDQNIILPLIKRNEYDGVHSGQISLPGGKTEIGDSNLIQTALREAEEELNIKAGKSQVLGEMTPVYIPPSNFIVQPVIAWLNKEPELIRQESEVSEILKVPISKLLDPASRMIRNIPHREYKIIDVPCFYIDKNIIWGATAMILSELIDMMTVD